jgi:hypothetical protein
MRAHLNIPVTGVASSRRCEVNASLAVFRMICGHRFFGTVSANGRGHDRRFRNIEDKVIRAMRNWLLRRKIASKPALRLGLPESRAPTSRFALRRGLPESRAPTSSLLYVEALVLALLRRACSTSRPSREFSRSYVEACKEWTHVQVGLVLRRATWGARFKARSAVTPQKSEDGAIIRSSRTPARGYDDEAATFRAGRKDMEWFSRKHR